jgi:hypothetical protein
VPAEPSPRDDVATAPSDDAAPEPTDDTVPALRVDTAAAPSDDTPAAPSDAAAAAHSEDTAPVEQERPPGRPSSVPRVTLSWREAESFDIGLPSVDADQEAIVVEPPSQLVAQSRRRRPEPRVTDEDDGDESGATNPTEHGRSDHGQEPEPADDRPDEPTASPRSGRMKWIVVGGLLLVVLALLAWYFLLRGSGDESAAPALCGSTVTASTSASMMPGSVGS